LGWITGFQSILLICSTKLIRQLSSLSFVKIIGNKSVSSIWSLISRSLGRSRYFVCLFKA
jgi:hypothetical protein